MLGKVHGLFVCFIHTYAFGSQETWFQLGKAHVLVAYRLFHSGRVDTTLFQHLEQVGPCAAAVYTCFCYASTLEAAMCFPGTTLDAAPRQTAWHQLIMRLAVHKDLASSQP